MQEEIIRIGFDYDSLSIEKKEFVKTKTAEIKILIKQTAQGIIEIGQRLIEVKDELPHGDFLKWLESEFEWSKSTAYNFINVAEKFPTVGSLINFYPRALYLLSAPSTPESAREEAINKAEQGEKITNEKAKELIEAHKQIEEKQNRIINLELQIEDLKSQLPTDEVLKKIELYESQVEKLKQDKEKLVKEDKEKYDKINKELKELKKDFDKKVKDSLLKYVASTMENIEIEEKSDFEVKENEWWQLGNQLLYCGDTATDKFINKLDKVSFAFADPPYNARAAKWDNDFNWKHDYLIDKAKIVAVTPGISSIFSFATITKMNYAWSIATWLTNGMTRGAIGFGNWIYTAIFSNEKSINKKAQDHLKATILTSENKETKHKGRKPSEYMTRLIMLFTADGDTIIDPFLGSGSTLLIAESLGRKCIGGEIDKDFCKEIILRWEKMTGQEGKRL